MIYYYIVHFVLLVYGGIQLIFLAAEVSGNSNTYTAAGVFIIPAVILSALRISIGRIALAFMALLGVLIMVGQIAFMLYSDGVFAWRWLFDLVFLGYVWHLFKPTGKWHHLYSKFGMFSKVKDPIRTEGQAYMERIRKGDCQPAQVEINFSDYCKVYLVERSELNEQQAVILLLDPELGKEIDNAKQKWLWEDIGIDAGVDVDDFLVLKKFDAPQMKRINLVLDRFAFEYPERESKIIEYLRSIGYL